MTPFIFNGDLRLSRHSKVCSTPLSANPIRITKFRAMGEGKIQVVEEKERSAAVVAGVGITPGRRLACPLLLAQVRAPFPAAPAYSIHIRHVTFTSCPLEFLTRSVLAAPLSPRPAASRGSCSEHANIKHLRRVHRCGTPDASSPPEVLESSSDIKVPEVSTSVIYADKITADSVVAELVYVRDLRRR